MNCTCQLFLVLLEAASNSLKRALEEERREQSRTCWRGLGERRWWNKDFENTKLTTKAKSSMTSETKKETKLSMTNVKRKPAHTESNSLSLPICQQITLHIPNTVTCSWSNKQKAEEQQRPPKQHACGWHCSSPVSLPTVREQRVGNAKAVLSLQPGCGNVTHIRWCWVKPVLL